jgi:hypothetical protein
VSEQLGQPPANHAGSAGVGLFVPKPSTGVDCRPGSTPGLGQTVRGCPLPSTSGGGDCHFTWSLSQPRKPLAINVSPIMTSDAAISSMNTGEAAACTSLALWAAKAASSA